MHGIKLGEGRKIYSERGRVKRGSRIEKSKSQKVVRKRACKLE